MSTSSTRLLAAVALCTAFAAQAQTSAADHAAHHPPAAGEAAVAAWAEGEVRRIDRSQQKLTLRHGPIASLDMPPMTMVFQAAEESLLDKVKVGDKVRFTADKVQGAYRVTAIEKAAE